MAAPSTPVRDATLLVVGTGIQWGGQVTLATQDALRRADKVLFAVADPWAARFVRSLNANAESLAYPRDGRPRREIYRAMSAQILLALHQFDRVCAAFYGSPTFLARAAHDAVAAARGAGYRARMLPGISSLECLAADLGIDLGETGYQLFEAHRFLAQPRPIDSSAYLVLCQIAMIGQRSAFDGDAARVRSGLAALAARLEPYFGSKHRVVVYDAATHPLASPRITETELCRLPSVEVSEVSTLCVPPLALTVGELRARSSSAPDFADRSLQDRFVAVQP